MLDDCTTRFLTSVGPLLSQGRLAAALAQLESNWPEAQLIAFLRHPSSAVTSLAARCLGYLRAPSAAPRLLHLLHHHDPAVCEAAEDGLWHLWMQGASPEQTAELAGAVARIGGGDYGGAERALRELIQADPEFAELHHQLGIALHSAGRADEALEAYHDALLYNPSHFNALVMCGHIQLERDEVHAALDSYEQALAIHPRLPDLERIVADLRADIRRRSVA